MTVETVDQLGEQQPLLPTRPAPVRTNPLPKLQLAAIYSVKLLVPIASTQIMPYVNLMIQELLENSGIESGKERVGYYSGLVVWLCVFFEYSMIQLVQLSAVDQHPYRSTSEYLSLGSPLR